MATLEIEPVRDVEPEGRLQLAAGLVEALARFGIGPCAIVHGTSDDGTPQLEILSGPRWMVIRALPGGRWWANGQRRRGVLGTGAVSWTDVMLREGNLEVLWPALLWVVGLARAS